MWNWDSILRALRYFLLGNPVLAGVRAVGVGRSRTEGIVIPMYEL